MAASRLAGNLSVNFEDLAGAESPVLGRDVSAFSWGASQETPCWRRFGRRNLANATLAHVLCRYSALEVWVVDENGHAVEGITVRLTWQNYSTETEGHEQDLNTDENGHVVFQARKSRVSILHRIFGTIRSATGGVHASFGVHATVFAFGLGLEGSAVTGDCLTDWTGRPDHMESRIVAKPML